jgi:hypothetical protein
VLLRTLDRNRLCRLNEGAADIVIADNAKFVRDAGLLAKPIAAGTPGQHGNDHVSPGRASCQFAPMVLRVVNVSAADDQSGREK